MVALRETACGITFAVKVQPRARRNAVIGESGDALKIALTSPPVENRANEACIAFLADILDVPRASVTIAVGHSSRIKVVRIQGATLKHVRTRLRS